MAFSFGEIVKGHPLAFKLPRNELMFAKSVSGG